MASPVILGRYAMLMIIVSGCAGSTDDAVCIGNSQCDGSARLSVWTKASHHRVPDSQERPQTDDDDRCERW